MYRLMYYILYSYLSKGGKLMNQYVEGWKIDVKNIERALGYMDKALGLDMRGDKIWFRFSAKDCASTNL